MTDLSRLATPVKKPFGWLFIVIGALLTVSMIVIARNMFAIIHAPSGGPSRWTGSHSMTVSMFWLFGAVFLFGLVALANGIAILRRGTFHPALRIVSLVIGGALFVGVMLFNLAHS